MSMHDQSAVDRLILAAQIIRSEGVASTSLLQKQMGLGFNVAIDLMDKLEALGCVSAPDEFGKRSISVLPHPPIRGKEVDQALEELG